MAAATAERLRSPTGILPGEVRALKRSEKLALAGWHTEVAGDDNGREWLPAAVRALAPPAQLYLAEDQDAHDAWVIRETRRAQDVDYFTSAYGSIGDDDEPGPAVPFAMWDAQRLVLADFDLYDKIVVLKARQLGLTWLALHYCLHLIAVDSAGGSAVVLGLSQDGGYAKRLLERGRAIHDRLPAYLRHAEDRATRGSKSEFKLAGRGRMVSLPGTPAAPRSWQADVALCDEWAFVRNSLAGPTMTALLPACRKIIAISSGNGGPDEEGIGQSFAKLYTQAAAGANDWHPVFLPTSTHPKRTQAWRSAERDNYDADEDFLAEHPETDDEALIGAGKDRYFKLGDIAAAVRLGGELDKLLGTDDMPPPHGGEIHSGIDWGENGVGLPIWPLERGGVYIPPGEVFGGGVEPGEQTIAIHDCLAELQEVDPQTGRLTPPVGEARYDSAGIQSMRTFLATARAKRSHQYANKEVRSRKVPFNRYKTETGKYLRRLFNRAGQGRTTGIVAISPANVKLIRQLRALESGPGGIWKKELDQDGPDALIAGVQRIARQHRELKEDK